MLKLCDGIEPRDVGFVKNLDGDWVYRVTERGEMRKLFTIYYGSQYIRFSKSAYISEIQCKLIYDWTKQNKIEWV